MWEKLYVLLEKNWDIFVQAPIAFLVAFASGAALGVLAMWYINKLYYEGHINALRGNIDTLNERLKAKDDVFNERIRGKDDLLSEYRESLHLAPTDQTVYSRLSHKELKQKNFNFC
jgi:hypothetical protein